MDNYIELRFDGVTAVERDFLVTGLSEIGFEGFEEQKDVLLAYIPQNAWDAARLQEVLAGHSFRYATQVIEPVNWNEEWEKNFPPVTVEDFCGIRASFHQPLQGVAYEIVITPKMSFGTGHHATTWLMVRTMRGLDLQDKNVLDFGTGTGVLAILAEKRGARAITAIDNDDLAIDNARENIAANQCTRIQLQQAGSPDMPDRFDVILANINKQVILASLGTMLQHLTPGGVIILSGLLKGDYDTVAAAAAAHGLAVFLHEEKGGWIVLGLTGQ